MAHDQEHRHHILDECKQFARYYIKEKLKIKVAEWGTPKFKKKKDCISIAITIKLITIHYCFSLFWNVNFAAGNSAKVVASSRT